MKQKIDWIIECCSNVTCDECGEVENSFLPYMCNAHTHGMGRYGHSDFQMVLYVPQKEIMRILNTFGLMVQQGRKFYNGEYVPGIYEDCSVRLMEFEETGRTVLRVVIPDKNNIYPEDSNCQLPYSLQHMETDALRVNGGALL